MVLNVQIETMFFVSFVRIKRLIGQAIRSKLKPKGEGKTFTIEGQTRNFYGGGIGSSVETKRPAFGASIIRKFRVFVPEK